MFIHTYTQGLKLKVQGHHLPSLYCTYALLPLTEEPVHIDYTILVSELNDGMISAQHIRYYSLKEGDYLEDLLVKFKNSLSLALLLKNTHNNYTLDQNFIEGVKPTTFPIIILTKDDGLKIDEFLKTHQTENVMARLDIVNGGIHLSEPQMQELPVESMNVTGADVATPPSHGL